MQRPIRYVNTPRGRITLALGLTVPLAATGAAAQTPEPTPAPKRAAAQPPAATSAKTPAKKPASFRVRTVRRTIVAGNRGVVRGTLRPGKAGRVVVLRGRTGGRSVTVDRARTRSGGRFTLRFRPKRVGTMRLRVVFTGDRTAKDAVRRVGTVNVFRRSFASWYGPGLYGNPLACGGRLGAGTLGVAHKTLPCGTRVTFRHKGRTARVRVIDRGPFVGGREWDLTAATKQRLGFGSTGTVLSTR